MACYSLVTMFKRDTKKGEMDRGRAMVMCSFATVETVYSHLCGQGERQ